VTVEFSQQEIFRYSRHLIMPEVGMAGQRRLKAARVLVVGAGGLGAPVTLYLAAAGVGRLGIVDHDQVELSNLQRQVLHSTSDVGRPKLASARDTLHAVNPEIEVVAHQTRLEAHNALELIGDYDLVVDGTDNFATRYLIGDACVLLGKPNVYGSIYRFDGQASVFDARRGPCYRCLYPEPPPPDLVPSCAEGGVLGVLPGIVGTIQALETIKLILDHGEPLIGRLLLIDGLRSRFREVRLPRNRDCPLCGEQKTITGLIDYQQFCGLSAAPATCEREIEAREASERIAQGGAVLIDVREPHEWEISRIEGAQLIPLSALLERMAEIPQDRDVILFCHVGIRSLRALRFLEEHAGLTRLWNLRGGIDAWSRDVDASVTRY
jgi:adenylyltransferase/sulfurtransferase